MKIKCKHKLSYEREEICPVEYKAIFQGERVPPYYLVTRFETIMVKICKKCGERL